MTHPISVTVNQAGKKPALPGWRLGRCVLRWLWGHWTIVIDVNQFGQSKPLHLMRRRYLKATEVSLCTRVQLWVPVETGSMGAEWGSPSSGHQGSLWWRDRSKVNLGKPIHWSGSGPVRVTRVRHSPLINRQVHMDKIKLGHQLAEMVTDVLQYHWD